MRTYDCQHTQVETLEKELLFKEVMRLRVLIVNAESILDEIDIDDQPSSLKNRIKDFLAE